MREQIIKKALELGIEKIGFSKNSVVALFPYFVEGEDGNLSLYSRSIDYHIILEEKLRKLSSVLIEGGANTIVVHVDKGEYNDRAAAYEAGLGFYGMNGMLICPEYGSYFFIGQIIHDLDIDAGEPFERDCLMCGRCERECPAKALSGGKVEPSICLSQITQKRGELTKDEERLIKKSGSVWGCDVCQRVCPHNQGLGTTAILEFLEDRVTSLSLGEIETLTNRTFREKYGSYAFSWRGRSVLLRNLRLLSEDTGHEEE